MPPGLLEVAGGQEETSSYDPWGWSGCAGLPGIVIGLMSHPAGLCHLWQVPSCSPDSGLFRGPSFDSWNRLGYSTVSSHQPCDILMVHDQYGWCCYVPAYNNVQYMVFLSEVETAVGAKE